MHTAVLGPTNAAVQNRGVLGEAPAHLRQTHQHDSPSRHWRRNQSASGSAASAWFGAGASATQKPPCVKWVSTALDDGALQRACSTLFTPRKLLPPTEAVYSFGRLRFLNGSVKFDSRSANSYLRARASQRCSIWR